jgi:hypothetical protein
MSGGSTRLGSALRAPVALVALGALAALGATGCYSYAYHVRGPGPNFSTLPIDKEPHAATRWSYLWGLRDDEWTPITCAKTDAATGACVQQVNVCDNGVGRIEVKLRPYSVLLMLITLGIVFPVSVNAYCSTQQGPASGP